MSDSTTNSANSSSKNSKGSTQSHTKSHFKNSGHRTNNVTQNGSVHFSQYPQHHQYPQHPQHHQYPQSQPVFYPVGGFGQASVMPPHMYSGKAFSNSNSGYGNEQDGGHMHPSSKYDGMGNNNNISGHGYALRNPTHGNVHSNGYACEESGQPSRPSQFNRPSQSSQSSQSSQAQATGDKNVRISKPHKDEHSSQAQIRHNVEPKNIFTGKASVSSDKSNVSFQNDHSVPISTPAPKSDKHDTKDKDTPSSPVSVLVNAFDSIPYDVDKNEIVNKLMESLLSRNRQGTKYYNNVITDLIKQLADNHIAMKEFYINTPEKHTMLTEIMGIFYHKGYYCQLSMRPTSNDKSFYAMITVTPN